MTDYVIRIIDRDVLVADKWLEAYDLDAMDGRGVAKLTDDPVRALRFATMAAAMAAWRTQSTRRPLREDGKPNRPLTAYTVEIEAAP